MSFYLRLKKGDLIKYYPVDNYTMIEMDIKQKNLNIKSPTKNLSISPKDWDEIDAFLERETIDEISRVVFRIGEDQEKNNG